VLRRPLKTELRPSVTKWISATVPETASGFLPLSWLVLAKPFPTTWPLARDLPDGIPGLAFLAQQASHDFSGVCLPWWIPDRTFLERNPGAGPSVFTLE